MCFRQREFERVIHDGLDEKNPELVRSWAEHAGQWVSAELSADVCEGIILAQTNWPRVIATIQQMAPELAVALTKLDTHVDQQRAEFMEEEAERWVAAEQRNREEREDSYRRAS